MNDRASFPSDHDVLRLILANQYEMKGEIVELKGQVERLLQAVPVPETYTHAQACRRLGISSSLGYKRPDLLPKPVFDNPRRYLVGDVEAILKANNGEGLKKWAHRLPPPARKRRVG
jgi:hypothetical protein